MPTREELQQRIAELNREINEVIDVNRLSAVRAQVFFPTLSWLFTAGITAWLFLGSYLLPNPKISWVPDEIMTKIMTYLPYLGLFLGLHAVYYTMSWLFYQASCAKTNYFASQKIVQDLETQRQALLMEIRSMDED